jgi:hypothetical protein
MGSIKRLLSKDISNQSNFLAYIKNRWMIKPIMDIHKVARSTVAWFLEEKTFEKILSMN